MANIIHVQVENPDELLNASAYGAGAIIRLQSGAAEAGPFSNEATATIVTATRSYTLYDADGTSAAWYRTRYENAGATLTSDWSAPFQVGDETAGLLCSIYDVEQRLGATLNANDRETMLDIIREVTTAIEGYCGRWFVPRPLSGTTTYTFDVDRQRKDLRIPVGIRSITTLEYATATGGSYTAISTHFLRPTAIELSTGWPFTKVCLSDITGDCFYPGYATVRILGEFGWAAVPHDVQGVAIEAVIRRWIGKARAEPTAFAGPNGGIALLRDISPGSAQILERYRHIPV